MTTSSSTFSPSSTMGTILCCQCGICIEPNTANMCLPCINATVDISEGIPRQIALQTCRGCSRYFQPPAQWLPAELESKELMALFLRRIKGLNKVRLVDAVFVWTEPHSKRIQVKLTIQREAHAVGSGNCILQKSFVVEAIVGNQQCPECTRLQAKNTWRAVVQVRQKGVDHKRTFLYLEQVILKHEAHAQCNNVKVLTKGDGGIDFYFDQRNAASKFVDFLSSFVPMRSKSSEQLITEDIHSGNATYKFTFSVEIVPVCKDDLVWLPLQSAKSMGTMPQLVLCDKVATSLHFIDTITLKTGEMQAGVYWKVPFISIASHRDLVEFIVLDVERDDSFNFKDSKDVDSRRVLGDVTVARASDFGRSSDTFVARSHLSNILKPGDFCFGYDLRTANINDFDFEQGMINSKHALPDIILVRKSYKHAEKGKHKKRPWTLKQLPVSIMTDIATSGDGDQEMNDFSVQGMASLVSDREYERFLEEIEEDKEMRTHMNLYHNPHQHHHSHAHQDPDMMQDSEVDDAPKVALEELLEDLCLEEDSYHE